MVRVVIVGGGVSGLATAWWLLDEAPAGVDVTVLEAGRRVGGKVGSEAGEGWLCEWGPASMLAGHPDTIDLLDGIGLGGSIVAASAAARYRYLFLRGRLRRLPVGPLDLLKGSAVRRRYLLRALLEPVWHGRPPASGRHETLAGLIGRHFGRGVVRDLLGPFVSGVFAGDPERLDAEGAFPRLFEVERKHHSIVRGLLRERKQARAGERKPKGRGTQDDQRPRRGLISLREGMGSLVERLADGLDERMRFEARVERLERRNVDGGGFRLTLEDGALLEADRIVLATPASEAARLLQDLDGDLSELLASVGSARAATVGLGYAAADIDVPRGFGVLVPRDAGVRILGCLFESQLFENRAPEGFELLRCILGGASDPTAADLSEEDLVHHAREGAARVLGVRARPRRVFVRRHELGIPQYAPGHAERRRRMDLLVERHQGLHLTGDSYRGISVNDCIREARRTARALVGARTEL